MFNQAIDIMITADCVDMIEDIIVVAYCVLTNETLQAGDVESFTLIVFKTLSFYKVIANFTNRIILFVEVLLAIWLIIENITGNAFRERFLTHDTFETSAMPLA